jgi:hypothetical protein
MRFPPCDGCDESLMLIQIGGLAPPRTGPLAQLTPARILADAVQHIEDGEQEGLPAASAMAR